MAAMAVVIFLAIGLHEYAHAKTADMAGDPTPRMMGRVTLNLTKHFDPIGTIMIILTSLTGFGIGWGKPVMVNPLKMRNMRWDHFWSVAAGPLSNLLQAGVWAIFLRLALISGTLPPGQFMVDFIPTLLIMGVLVNLSLAFFNLIPLGPLDGHWLVGAFLKDDTRHRWYRFNQTQGSFLLLALIIMGQISASGGGPSFLGSIIRPPVDFCFRFLTGIPI